MERETTVMEITIMETMVMVTLIVEARTPLYEFAVSSLTSLDPSKLVFSEHKKAGVLCDSTDNCATPGQMVEYEARAMMMRHYCKEVGHCMKRVKLVNSIKMTAGLILD